MKIPFKEFYIITWTARTYFSWFLQRCLFLWCNIAISHVYSKSISIHWISKLSVLPDSNTWCVVEVLGVRKCPGVCWKAAARPQRSVTSVARSPACNLRCAFNASRFVQSNPHSLEINKNRNQYYFQKCISLQWNFTVFAKSYSFKISIEPPQMVTVSTGKINDF